MPYEHFIFLSAQCPCNGEIINQRFSCSPFPSCAFEEVLWYMCQISVKLCVQALKCHI